MSDLDIDKLLVQVSEDAPCGEDIEADLSYFSLVDLVQPKGQGMVAAGQDRPAEEPNWGEVGRTSVSLLQRSRHLNVAMYLTLSLLQRNGLSGLRDGLSLVRGLLDRFWDSVYPQLDASDGHDPLQRISIVQSLSPRSASDQDPFRFKQRVLELPLCRSRQMGSFGLKDIQIARGELPSTAGGQGAAAMPVIEAAFRDTPADELLATSQAAREAVEHLDAIVAVFAEKAVAGQTPDLTGLRTMLRDIDRVVQQFLGGGDLHKPAEAEGPDGTASPLEGGASSAGEIRSRKDALLALERICRYFDQSEPSSPVPLLLRRAQRLVSKSFVEIVRDICPEAMGQINAISGALPQGDGDQQGS